jgi:hypothetical protein
VQAVLAGAGAWLGQRRACAAAVPSDAPGLGELVGRVRPRSGREIDASPLSVGMETLDRRMFDPARTYEHVGRLGVKWARLQTGWARTETTAGQYDFAWLDEVVDSLRKLGIEPWFNLGYGNRLYTPRADPFGVGWAPLDGDEARAGWLRYVGAIAERFRGRVRHWEIWNEPNIATFWKGDKPSPARYVELVSMTAPEIRKRVPGAVIVGGALAGMPTDYLKGCLEAGLGRHVDKISYHPYRPVPEKGYETAVATWRKLLAQHNPKLGLWQGENGCPSQNGGAGALRDLDWNETRQAKWLLRRILSDLRLGIELTSYFHLVDLVNYNWGGGSTGQTNFKGLLRGTDYTPKPSYYAYQCLAALFDAKTERAGAEYRLRLLPGTAEQPKEDALVYAVFTRQGRVLGAYWHAASLQEDTPTRSVRVELSVPADHLAQPVLVDPLANRVYRIAQQTQSGGRLAFGNLPLADYPLIIADRSVI